MKSEDTRSSYVSPLRKEQANETRQRILRAVSNLLKSRSETSLSIDEVAQEAGVERRTVFRHFGNRDGLLAAFWAWLNTEASTPNWPQTEADLSTMPPTHFAGFDRLEGVIRAALHSDAGRELRLKQNADRRAGFEKATANALAGLDEREALRIRAVVQLLYSASAWQSMKDYWGLSGSEAGAASAWAIETLLAAARAKAAKPDKPARQGKQKP
jgi:AcrR family transcriptional regulator